MAGASGLAATVVAGGAWAGEPVVTDVSANGLVGKFYAGPTSEQRRRSAVLMLGGSGGGFPDPKAAMAMAGAGHPVLALAYFRGFAGATLTSLPAQLKDIPLEYFFKAIDWMKTRPEVNPKKIVLMGESRGGELVLQLGSMRPDVAGVVAYVPSHLRWGAVGGQGDSWTLGGKPLAWMRDDWKMGEPMVNGFVRTLDRATPAELEAAAIPVEKIRGSVLLFSSTADQIWPSSRFAEAAIERMRAKGKRGARDHFAYADASHLMMGPGPGITSYGEGQYRIDFGGTMEGTLKARDDAWAKSVAFMGKL
jgi:dienelactone hydrolase